MSQTEEHSDHELLWLQTFEYWIAWVQVCAINLNHN